MNKLRPDQILKQRLIQHYSTNTLTFHIVILNDVLDSEFMDISKEFHNDSDIQRYYGSYLVVTNKPLKKDYIIPYFPSLSYHIITTMIDTFLKLDNEILEVCNGEEFNGKELNEDFLAIDRENSTEKKKEGW